MRKVWIVEAQFKTGDWGVASFFGEEWASTNFYQAHRMKRAIQQEAKKMYKHWSKKRFRVRGYTGTSEAAKEIKRLFGRHK